MDATLGAVGTIERQQAKPRWRPGEALGWAAMALTVILLVAMLPGPAAAGGNRPLAAPAPLPAPAPLGASVVTAAGFPEQATPAGGCLALIDQSAAPSAPRSARASQITGALFQEACFGS